MPRLFLRRTHESVETNVAMDKSDNLKEAIMALKNNQEVSADCDTSNDLKFLELIEISQDKRQFEKLL